MEDEVSVEVPSLGGKLSIAVIAVAVVVDLAWSELLSDVVADALSARK